MSFAREINNVCQFNAKESRSKTEVLKDINEAYHKPEPSGESRRLFKISPDIHLRHLGISPIPKNSYSAFPSRLSDYWSPSAILSPPSLFYLENDVALKPSRLSLNTFYLMQLPQAPTISSLSMENLNQNVKCIYIHLTT